MPSSSSMGITNEVSAEALTRLRTHFGHREYRDGQEQIVEAVLGGHDVLAVMPTGSGKSLTYQLPAIVLPGTTLVVSPLISLMKDQVDELNRRGIRSGALHSMLTADGRYNVLNAARSGRLRLLYVAPERFASDQFLRLLSELPVARFVVDEAHCVSEWGHDFRPDYRRLAAAAARCTASDRAGRPPIAAFTATATPEVRDDIIALLGLEQPRVLVAGFDRPNIYLRVERVEDEEEKDARLPHLVRGRRALVYAATRKSAEAAASVLNAAGVNASAYHAGLKEDVRTRVQDTFARGALPVVCATNAFGMGIDRPDVDAVVHYANPRITRGVLPGDRARRPRRARGDRHPAVGSGRRRDARILDRQPAARPARTDGRDPRSRRACAPKRARTPQAAPDDRVRGQRGVSARRHSSILRRRRRAGALRCLR
jgi:ATP-dependent DNA helicase RecQ